MCGDLPGKLMRLFGHQVVNNNLLCSKVNNCYPLVIHIKSCQRRRSRRLTRFQILDLNRPIQPPQIWMVSLDFLRKIEDHR